MAEVEQLEIEGRVYALRTMPPLQALAFAPKVATMLAGVLTGQLEQLARSYRAGNLAAMGAVVLELLPKIPAEQFTALAREAFGYEVYAGNAKLSDNTHFTNWFRDHPGDLLPVASWAIWSHAKPYFLESPAGFKAAFIGGGFQYPTDGKQTT